MNILSLITPLCAFEFWQIASKDLLPLDFEGILTYFRVHLPKKFQTEDEAKHLFHCMSTYNKLTEKKLAKLEKDYQLFVERQAQLEDPVMRLEVRTPYLDKVCAVSNKGIFDISKGH